MLNRFDGDSLGMLDDNSDGHNVNSSEGGTLGEVLELMLGRFDGDLLGMLDENSEGDTLG